MHNELYHFNPNHDRLGRFSKSSGGGSVGRKLSSIRAKSKEKKALRVANKEAIKNQDKDSKKRRTLSDVDLKKKIERLENEKKLKTLTDESIRPGKTFVKKALATGTQKALSTAIAGAESYLIKAALQQKFNSSDLGDAMFRGGAKKDK